jgi:hypothetical protein
MQQQNGAINRYCGAGRAMLQSLGNFLRRARQSTGFGPRQT